MTNNETKKLTLNRETLWNLTTTELRLVAGGQGGIKGTNSSNVPTPPPGSGGC